MSEETMLGGLTGEKPASHEVQQISDKVRKAAEMKVGISFDKNIAISFKSQVVAGINYFVKVQIADENYIHIRIYVPLPGMGDPELQGCLSGKSLQDAIEYF